jgi:hypothetical protein
LLPKEPLCLDFIHMVNPLAWSCYQSSVTVSEEAEPEAFSWSALAAGPASLLRGRPAGLQLAPELTVEAAREEKSKTREPPLFMWQLDVSICHKWTVGTAVPGRSAIARRYPRMCVVSRPSPSANSQPPRHSTGCSGHVGQAQAPVFLSFPSGPSRPAAQG